MYPPHNIGSRENRNIIGGDRYNDDVIEYYGYVAPELVIFYSTLLYKAAKSLSLTVIFIRRLQIGL